jgi:hypothetical protein
MPRSSSFLPGTARYPIVKGASDADELECVHQLVEFEATVTVRPRLIRAAWQAIRMIRPLPVGPYAWLPTRCTVALLRQGFGGHPAARYTVSNPAWRAARSRVVETKGIEPSTFALRTRRSPS